MSPRQQILKLMLPNPLKWWYGLEINRATGLGNGTVLRQLYSLERENILESRWEDSEEAKAESRPPLRFYRLTPRGRTVAPQELEPKQPGGNRLLRPSPAPA